MNYKIASIAGDGIGPEIVREARKVLDKIGQKYGHTFEYEELLMGGCSIDVYGESLTDETLEKAKACDSILLGAVGGNVGQSNWYQIEPSKRPEAGLLKIRKGLGLYANIRPAILFDELSGACPLKPELTEGGFDFVVMRELTGGLYFGERKTIEENGVTKAIDTLSYDENEIRRIAKWGFDVAMKRNKKVIGVSCFVLLLLVGIMYVYVHPVNRYRLEVTRVGGSGYGYKIYERERLIIVQPFLLAQSCHLTGTTVSIWWHWSANTMAQGKALSTDYLFSSSLGATT